MVEDVHQHLQDPGDDLGPARRTDAHSQLVAVEHEGRSHARHPRLAGPHRVRVARPRIEAVHIVVVAEAQPGRDDAAGGAEGVRERHCVALVVDGANVCRVRAVVHRSDCGPGHLSRLGGIRLVGQCTRGHLDEPGVSDVQLAVGHRPCHRLHQQPRTFRARPAIGAQVVALEKVQHLQQGDAGRRRPRRHDRQPPIVAP